MRKEIYLIASACLLLFVANLFWGSIHIDAATVWQVLTGRAGGDDTTRIILLQSRLPQAITALLSGAALAVSGLMLQTSFSNPLADPSILGVNAGASLGVALAVMMLGGAVTAGTFSLSGYALILLMAFVGSIGIIALLIFFSSLLRSSLMLLIAGIMVSYLVSSLIALFTYSATAEGVHSYAVWGMGSFTGVTCDQLPLFASLIVLGLIAAIALIKPLNALLLGERYAANLGIATRRVRTQLLIVTGLLSAVTTAFCGPISFLGLAVPHIARLLLGTSNHRQLLPATLLCGAAVALLCNLLCALPISGGLLPLGVVTPLVSVPVILYVIICRRNVVN